MSITQAGFLSYLLQKLVIQVRTMHACMFILQELMQEQVCMQ